MRGLGITVDFAPVVDVSDQGCQHRDRRPLVLQRPRHRDRLRRGVRRGLRDAGLLPVLKHFPGHGHGSGIRIPPGW